MRDCNSSLSKIAEDETPTITMTMSHEMSLSKEIIPKSPERKDYTKEPQVGLQYDAEQNQENSEGGRGNPNVV